MSLCRMPHSAPVSAPRYASSRALRTAVLTHGMALLLALAGCSRTELYAPESQSLSGLAGSDRPAQVDPRCGPDSDRIYLLSSSNTLLEFDPGTVTARPLGVVTCGARLNSMSISRDAVAHVASSDGQLFEVSLDTLECIPTTFEPWQLIGERFGMGYVATAGEAKEQLYIAEIGGIGIGTAERLSVIDIPSFELRPVARFDPPASAMELTGTGDGRLYGYVAESLPRLIEVDPATAATTELATLPELIDASAFDFAFWNGDFYLFASTANDARSRVLRLNFATGASENLGRIDAEVIGAGVSTCAD